MRSFWQNEFEIAIRNQTYQIDRTPYIEKLETSGEPFVICLRPKGFNRHLFVSMLMTYYGTEYAPLSKSLFKQLYIGRHPLTIANSFATVLFDFSTIAASSLSATKNIYQKSIQAGIEDFIYRYQPVEQFYYPESPSPKTVIDHFIDIYQSYNLFFFILEYEGFLPEILDPDINDFPGFRSRNPFIRDIYAGIKTAQSTRLLKKVFVMGMDEGPNRSTRGILS